MLGIGIIFLLFHHFSLTDLFYRFIQVSWWKILSLSKNVIILSLFLNDISTEYRFLFSIYLSFRILNISFHCFLFVCIIAIEKSAFLFFVVNIALFL